MFEEKTQGFLSLDVGGDPAQGSVFFKPEANSGKGFPLAAGDYFDLLVHLVAGGVDAFPLRNFRKQERGLHLA